MPPEGASSPDRTEAAPVHAPAGRPPDRLARAKQFLSQGLRILGVAARKMLWRALAWGAGAIAVSIATDAVLYATGLLDHPWPPWRWIVFALFPVHAIAAALLLGYAGVWRGLGRTILHVGVELGYVTYTVDAVLRRASRLARGSAGAAAAMDRAEELARDVPLDRAESAIKQGLGLHLRTDEMQEGSSGPVRWLQRKIKRVVCAAVERYLLRVVRAERDAAGRGGGVSMQKVHAVAIERLDSVVTDFVVGKMNLMTGLMIGAQVLLLALPPSVLAALRAWS